MNKHKIKLKLVALFAFVVALLLSEVFVRLWVIRPGHINVLGGFNRVDSLIEYQNFCTDEVGIYKFSPWITDSLLVYYDCKTRKVTNPSVKAAIFDGDKIYYVYQSFCKEKTNVDFSLRWWLNAIHNGEENPVSCLKLTKDKLLNHQLSFDKGWQAAFLDYCEHPFNTDGFRGIALKEHQTTQLKVLIIGDSFVYGMDAHPMQNSFTDLLLTKGYLVYACGIPGTDPAQYAAIAEKYIPIVKPDVVISCFYTGNDYMNYYREPKSNEPHEYITNAGFYSSNPTGVHMSVFEAYNLYVHLSTFPDSNNRTFDRLCSRSGLGTLLWNALYQKGYRSHPSQQYFGLAHQIPKDSIYARTKTYADRFANTCKKYNVPQLAAVIPDLDSPHFDTLGLQILFDNNYYMPNNLVLEEDYFEKGFHFNNSGSIKFANFLDSLLHPFATQKSIRLNSTKND